MLIKQDVVQFQPLPQGALRSMALKRHTHRMGLRKYFLVLYYYNNIVGPWYGRCYVSIIHAWDIYK